MMENTKKKVYKLVLGLLLHTMSSALITACGGSGGKPQAEVGDAEPVNVAFLVGKADDETRFNEGIGEVKALPAKPGSDYTFISIEGNPAVIGEPGSIPDFEDKGYTDTMMSRVREGIRQDLMQRLEAYEPETGEIDIARSVELGVQALRARMLPDRKNFLVLYCGGKSTKGLINMLETPLYQIDVDTSVHGIAKAMNIDMSGIEVLWYCAGEFGPKQARLSPEEKAKLRSFYEKLFLALGAESVTFREDLPSKEYYVFASAKVSSMAVAGEVSGLQALKELDPELLKEADEDLLKTPHVLADDKVHYLPDTAEFEDPAAAKEVIRPFAEFLNMFPEKSVLLYGSCAGDSDTAFSLELARSRAQSVKEELIANGIEETRIHVATVKKPDDPYFKYGLGTGEAASVNRRCVIIDSEAPLAKQILARAE